jgi:hypothetical protein
MAESCEHLGQTERARELRAEFNARVPDATAIAARAGV